MAISSIAAAIFGLTGVVVGGYIQFSLQKDRHRREERAALIRVDALLGDIEIFVAYALRDGYIDAGAWQVRIGRLMRHTELPASATAFRKKPKRYAYVLRVAAAIERQSTHLTGKDLAPPTQRDIDDWQQSLNRPYDRRLLLQIARETHQDTVRAWVELLVGPIERARADVKEELAPQLWWDIKPKQAEISPGGIHLAKDLRDVDLPDIREP